MECPICGAQTAEQNQHCPNCMPKFSQDETTLDATPNQDDYLENPSLWLRTFIGDKNQAFYFSHFSRFRSLKRTAISWNWPAFFITFYWLLYRKMWLNALLYTILTYLALIPVFIVAALHGGSNAFGIAYIVYLLALFILPALFANGLYYKHFERKLQLTRETRKSNQWQLGMLSEKGGTSHGALIALLIAMLIFMLGILLAIAIPAYQDYTVRAKIATAINTASSAKLAVAETYLTTGTVPKDNSAAGYAFSKATSDVNDIRIKDGIITIVMATPPIDRGTLVLEPFENTDKTIGWDCYSPDIEKKYLPKACRE